MNKLFKNLIGMGKMSDQVIATDFLIAAKSGVQNYAMAITETASPEIRKVLREQLRDAIETHEIISRYMMEKGYYHTHNLNEQFLLDMQTTDTALRLADKAH